MHYFLILLFGMQVFQESITDTTAMLQNHTRTQDEQVCCYGHATYKLYKDYRILSQQLKKIQQNLTSLSSIVDGIMHEFQVSKRFFEFLKDRS